jgi:hypothetical protein
MNPDPKHWLIVPFPIALMTSDIGIYHYLQYRYRYRKVLRYCTCTIPVPHLLVILFGFFKVFLNANQPFPFTNLKTVKRSDRIAVCCIRKFVNSVSFPESSRARGSGFIIRIRMKKSTQEGKLTSLKS